ncbi:MAG: hypothetical protein ACO1RX_22860 [Candidatus Sericytochromatia bacterium]
MSVKWIPFKPCEDPDARLIFDAIRARNIDVLKSYAEQGFDWESLAFNIACINTIYMSTLSRKNVMDDDIFYHLLKELNIPDLEKEWSSYLWDIREKIASTCDSDNPDFEFIQEYIKYGYDFHCCDAFFLYAVLSYKHLELADNLYQNGAKPSQWPGILRKVMDSADTEFWFEYPVNKDFSYDLDRIIFLLERGAEPNHMVNAPPNSKYLETPLDMMARLGPPEGCKLIRSYGGKLAEEILEEQGASEAEIREKIHRVEGKTIKQRLIEQGII